MMQEWRVADREREERMEKERLAFEQKRLDAENEHREKIEKIENKKAAWAKWEVENKEYLQKQADKWWWDRDSNWENGLSKPSN